MKFLRGAPFWIVTATFAIYALVFYGMHGTGEKFFRSYAYPIDRAYQAPQDGGIDQLEFAYLGENLLLKKAFTLSDNRPYTPETWRTPGYPAFLALLLLIFHSYLAIVIIQVFLVAITGVFIFHMGQSLLSRATGLIAALLYILHPTTITNALDIFSDTLFVFLLTGSVWALFFLRERKTNFHLLKTVLGGMALGAATLVRPLGMYIPFLLAPAYALDMRNSKPLRNILAAIAVLLAGYSLLVAPWLVRNRNVSGHFALSSLGAYHLYFYGVGSFITEKTRIHDAVIRNTLRQQIGIQDEQQLRSFASAATLHTATQQHILAEPFAYAMFYLKGLVRFFLATSIGSIVLSMPALQNILPPLHHLFILERMLWLGIFTLSAIPLLTYAAKKRLPILLFAVIIIYFAAFGGLFPSPRYRLPALPFLFILAAIGFYTVHSMINPVRWLRTAAFALAGSRIGRTLAMLLNRFGSFQKPIAFAIDGKIFFARKLDRIVALWLYKRGALENAEHRIFSDTVREGWSVVDIGANLGIYTVLASALAGNSGKIFAFEPDEENFSMLEKNIAANRCANVRACRQAVGEASGEARLYISPEHSGDHKIYDTGDGRPSVSIAQTALDDVFNPGTRVDLVKMDIQGGEMRALKGMQRVLQENTHIILLCEFSPADLKKAGSSADQFLSALLDLHFLLAYINEETGRITPASPEELMAICKTKSYVNLFLQRRAFAH